MTTPLWVWGIFVYILYVGIRVSRNHTAYIPRLFIVPLVLTGLKYNVFLSGNFWMYGGGIVIGTLIGRFVAMKAPARILKDSMSVELTGSYSTLILLIIFFMFKYVFGYLHSVHPQIAEQYEFIDLIGSGMLSGYFLGRAIYYVYCFIKKAD
jgi:hypothetical protein